MVYFDASDHLGRSPAAMMRSLQPFPVNGVDEHCAATSSIAKGWLVTRPRRRCKMSANATRPGVRRPGRSQIFQPYFEMYPRQELP
jgi:hypothetical protein